MDFNDHGKYNIKSLSRESKYLRKKIKNVVLLDSNKTVEWEQTSEGLSIKTGPGHKGKYACVFKVMI